MGERRFGDAWEAEVAKRAADMGRSQRQRAARDGAGHGWLAMARPEAEPAVPSDAPFTDPLQELSDAEESLARGRWLRGMDGDDVWITEQPERWEPPAHPPMPTRADLLFHRLARMYAQWRGEAGPMSISEAIARVPDAEWTRLFEECMGVGPSREPAQGRGSPASVANGPPAWRAGMAARGSANLATALARLPQRTLFGRPNPLERPDEQ